MLPEYLIRASVPEAITWTVAMPSFTLAILNSTLPFPYTFTETGSLSSSSEKNRLPEPMIPASDDTLTDSFVLATYTKYAPGLITESVYVA